MDIKELLGSTWQTVKEKLSPIFEKLSEYIRENKMISACIGSLVVLVIISIFLFASLLKKPESKPFERNLTITEEMFVPPSPAVPDGYNPSRITKENWTNEEADIWFTKPGNKELEDLSRANDRIINEITGAAP